MNYLTSAVVDDLITNDEIFKTELIKIFKESQQNLKPLPTGESYKNKLSSGIEIYLFDIYGTLIISQSGDVGTAKTSGKKELIRTALGKVNISPLRDDQVNQVHEAYFEEIHLSHLRSKEDGISYPEVDIINIWHRVLESTLIADGFPIDPTAELLARIAVYYESLSNQTAPMPGAKELLNAIKAKDLPMGIVSNAQFYTPLLLEALFDHNLEDLGFNPDYCIWSYQKGLGKPSGELFTMALETLKDLEVEASSILYTGNDVTKDIIPSKKQNIKAVLFAGDQRSLKMGEKDPLYSYIKPDIILTELKQLQNLI